MRIACVLGAFVVFELAACGKLLDRHRDDKTTMGTMVIVASAVKAYRDDRGSYPRAPLGSVTSLREPLKQYFTGEMPVNDAFGSELQYVSNGTSFILWSLGGNRRFDPLAPGGSVEPPHDDIILSDSHDTFWQGPKGLCCIMTAAATNPVAALRRANPELFGEHPSSRRVGF